MDVLARLSRLDGWELVLNCCEHGIVVAKATKADKVIGEVCLLLAETRLLKEGRVAFQDGVASVFTRACDLTPESRSVLTARLADLAKRNATPLSCSAQQSVD